MHKLHHHHHLAGVLTRFTLLALLVLLACATTAPQAQTVTDPTRPPASAMPSAAADPTERSGDAATRLLRPALPASAPAAPPQVQSIQRSATGATNALVDGRLVRVGERIGDQTIVAIDAHGVQLRGARGALQTLTLLSGVDKTPSLGRTEPAQALAAAPRKNPP